MENELVVIEAGKELEFFTGGGLEPFLLEVKNMVDGFTHDMTTKKGRDKTRSFARKIATFKVLVEDSGKELVSDWKTKAKKVDESRKNSRDTLDELRDKARAPLTEWEDAEKKRVAGHQLEIENLKALVENEEETSAVFAANLSLAKLVNMGPCWEEFAGEAAKVKDEVILYLEGALAKALKLEAEQAELERLRIADEARKQQERDDKIAKEAADKARAEEVQKATDLAKKVEADKVEQAAAVKRDKEAEAARIQRETDDKQAAQEKREANKRHVNKINKQAVESLCKLGVTKTTAEIIVAAIADGKIANVSINY